MTRAIEVLRLSLSAVSMAQAEREKLLGEKLFDRQGNRLLVNDQGRALVALETPFWTCGEISIDCCTARNTG